MAGRVWWGNGWVVKVLKVEGGGWMDGRTGRALVIMDGWWNTAGLCGLFRVHLGSAFGMGHTTTTSTVSMVLELLLCFNA